MQQTAQRQACTYRGQALNHLGHVQGKLHRIQEGPVDLGLVRVGEFPHQVDHAAQRRIALERRHQVHANNGRGQCGHHFAEGLHRLRHVLGNGQQEIHHRGLQVHADILDREIWQGYNLVVKSPIPIQHHVALQLGQAGHTQLHPQVQMRVDAEISLDNFCRVGQHRIKRQTIGLVANQVQRQLAIEPAGLEARLGQVLVQIPDLGLENKQLTFALEGRELVKVIGRTVQISLQLKLQLFAAVGIGSQVKTIDG